jgi:hypothetical protein
MKIDSETSKKTSQLNSKNLTPSLDLILKSLLVFILSFIIGSFFYQQGFAREMKYLFQGRFEEMQEGTLKSTMLDLSDQLGGEVEAYVGNDLPTLFLDIPFKNYQQLQARRNAAVESGILLATDADYVLAKIRYNDSAPINVKIRLKGDWSDHIAGEKWSFRINIQDQNVVEGMKRFSIQAPETRNFIYEWAYHQTLMQESILTPRYHFVNVINNGVYMGIYAMEESFYTELMESQEHRAGVILRYDETDMWQNWATYFSVGKEDLRTLAQTSGYFMHADYSSARVSSFSSGSLLTDPILVEEYRTGQSMLRGYQSGKLSAAQVFDMEVLGKYLAVTELWGAGHAFDWQNIRFYYNPVTNLLEPIGYDGMAMNVYYSSLDLNTSLSQCILFEDKDVWNAFYQAAKVIFQPAYLQGIREKIDGTASGFATALAKEYKFETAIDWDLMNERAIRLQSDLEKLNQSKSIQYTTVQ